MLLARKLMWIVPRHPRLIPQFIGDNYATLDTAITFTGDFEVEVECAVPNYLLVTNQTLAGYSGGTTDLIQTKNTGEVIGRIANTTLKIAPTGTPYDAQTHVWRLVRIGAVGYLYIDEVLQATIAVPTTTVIYDMVGTNSTGTALLRGHIPYIKFTDNSGTPVVTEYVLDTKTPTGITYTNMDDVDWHNYKYNTDLSRWDYQGSGTAGSQLMQFEGTATTPLSSSITVTGSTWVMNWEGLWVAHYASGVGAYTYLAVPDGVPMRCNIEVMDDVTAYSMINEKTTVQSVDNVLAAFAASVTRAPRVCDVTLTGNSIPTAAGLANKAIIEAEGGTVLVDS